MRWLPFAPYLDWPSPAQRSPSFVRKLSSWASWGFVACTPRATVHHYNEVSEDSWIQGFNDFCLKLAPFLAYFQEFPVFHYQVAMVAYTACCCREEVGNGLKDLKFRQLLFSAGKLEPVTLPPLICVARALVLLSSQWTTILRVPDLIPLDTAMRWRWTLFRDFFEFDPSR